MKAARTARSLRFRHLRVTVIVLTSKTAYCVCSATMHTPGVGWAVVTLPPATSGYTAVASNDSVVICSEIQYFWDEMTQD